MSSPGMKVAMGRVLLVCNDVGDVQHVTEGMQQFSIATEACKKVSLALRVLNHQHFEAVVVDLGLDRANEVL
jgi:hypothetical protein